MSVEVVATGVKQVVGEGPHWEDDKQSLLYVDSTEGDIMRWTPDTKTLTTISLNDVVGAVVPCEAGGYLASVGRSISHVNWETQEVVKQCEVNSVGADDRLNDGKCDASGRFWTGTMGTKESDLPAYELEVGVLYSLNLEGSLTQHLDKLNISNGMAWTADNRTMFYTHSIPKKIYAFDYDIDKGTISNQRVAIDITKFEDNMMIGNPDGLTIDTDDHLWVTCFFFGKVCCFDPNTNQLLRTISFPTKKTTSCCFGGKNLDELYVTSASYCIKDEEPQEYPDSGSLFRVTGLGVKGRPANVYKGKINL